MRHYLILLFFICSVVSVPAFAQVTQDYSEPPIYLDDLINIKRNKKPLEGSESLPLNIRLDAQEEAAISYGARGGLAWRTWHIRKEMEERARYLDKIFNFRELLIAAPSGLMIEPPVVTEAMDALIINGQGAQAAVADKILRINQNAQIVSTPRTWRLYLEREWGEVEPPPDVLRPSSKEEREAWEENVRKGWEKGIEQADEIFQADLNQLVSDYQGMVRYKSLLVQGMITPPYAQQTDRGVTGGGNVMRIGDRALQITEMPKLQAGSDTWQPANR